MRKIKAAVLAIGVLNILTGKTMYDWSIYDYPEGEVHLMGRSLLYGAPDGLKVGDEVELRGNDTGRLLRANGIYSNIITDTAKCNKEDVLAMLKRNGFDYYPLRAFQPRAKSNKKLMTSYSIKGLELMEEVTK